MDTLTPAQLRKWAAGRVWAVRQAPYLAPALLALEPIVVDGIGGGPWAFPADLAWHIYVPPSALDEVGASEIGFWLLHQVSHLLRRHADRRPGPDGGCVWNLATDAEINDDLRTDALRLPAGAVTPAFLCLPPGRTAEQYWDELSQIEVGPKRADCGTGCDGLSREWNRDFQGLSEIRARALRQDVAGRIREHWRGQADVPAGWRRWADETLGPVMNWRQVLRAAARRRLADVAGQVDFTYRRPSRRAAAMPDVVLPSLFRPLPTVAVVIDTSASMTDRMLAQVLGEVSGLLAGLGVARSRLHVVCCDAQAYPAQRVLNVRKIRLRGGGGTDMGAGLAAAADLKPRPDLVLVLTDGHTPWPVRPPRTGRVLVGLLDAGGSVPGWATSVTIDPREMGGGS